MDIPRQNETEEYNATCGPFSKPLKIRGKIKGSTRTILKTAARAKNQI